MPAPATAGLTNRNTAAMAIVLPTAFSTNKDFLCFSWNFFPLASSNKMGAQALQSLARRRHHGRACARRHGRLNHCLRGKKSVLLYLLPGLLGLVIFYIVPFISGIYYSFTDGSYKNAFVWFDNYKSVWQKRDVPAGAKEHHAAFLRLHAAGVGAFLSGGGFAQPAQAQRARFSATAF